MSRSGIKSRMFLLLCCLCLCLAGCSAADIPQPTKAELLAEVNAEHKAVEKELIDDSQYLRKDVDEKTRAQYYTAPEKQYDPEQELTWQQAEEDVNYLFDAFYNCYSLYDYFGGKKRSTRRRRRSCRRSASGRR